MTVTYIVATLHLITFGLGFSACWARASALQKLKDSQGLKAVFMADNLWGLAALLWIGTGVWRAFGGIEKGTDYYLHNSAFLVKMGLFVLLLLLEMKPMITLIRWRIREGKGESVDFSAAPGLARTTYLELVLLLPVVMAATASARGLWY